MSLYELDALSQHFVVPIVAVNLVVTTLHHNLNTANPCLLFGGNWQDDLLE